MTFVFWHITPKRNSRYDNVVQHAEKANAQIGTFGFCRPTIQTQKTKRAYFFYPRSNRSTMKRTKSILKNEINEKFELF